jgi:acetyl esterase/lipase
MAYRPPALQGSAVAAATSVAPVFDAGAVASAGQLLFCAVSVIANTDPGISVSGAGWTQVGTTVVNASGLGVTTATFVKLAAAGGETGPGTISWTGSLHASAVVAAYNLSNATVDAAVTATATGTVAVGSTFSIPGAAATGHSPSLEIAVVAHSRVLASLTTPGDGFTDERDAASTGSTTSIASIRLLDKDSASANTPAPGMSQAGAAAVVWAGAVYSFYAGTGGGAAPANTVAPVASGTPGVGNTLSVTNGTWTNSPSSFSYQWLQDDGINPLIQIPGAVSSTYVQQSTDVAYSLRCTVTATNASGSASADSNDVGPVPPTTTGYTFTANAGTYLSSDGVTSYSYDTYVPASKNGILLVLAHGGQWQSNTKTDISDAGDFFAPLGYVCVAYDFKQGTTGVSGVATTIAQRQIDDVAAMIAHARTIAVSLGCDPNRVAILGESSGGHLALMVACTKVGVSKPDAVIAWSPPSDLSTLTPTPLGYAKGYLDDNAPTQLEYDNFSPTKKVTSAAPPLRVAGSQSEQIPVGQFDGFKAAADTALANCTEATYPGSAHAKLAGKDGAAADTWLRAALPAPAGARLTLSQHGGGSSTAVSAHAQGGYTAISQHATGTSTPVSGHSGVPGYTEVSGH